MSKRYTAVIVLTNGGNVTERIEAFTMAGAIKQLMDKEFFHTFLCREEVQSLTVEV